MPFIDRTELKAKTIFAGHRAKLIHCETMTLAYWDIQEGATVPEHRHHHEQVVNIVTGEYELTVDGTAHLLKPGHVFVIPSDVVHSGRAITECKMLDVFSPVREDYL